MVWFGFPEFAVVRFGIILIWVFRLFGLGFGILVVWLRVRVLLWLLFEDCGFMFLFWWVFMWLVRSGDVWCGWVGFCGACRIAYGIL